MDDFERRAWCACHTYVLVGEDDVREVAGMLHTAISYLLASEAS